MGHTQNPRRLSLPEKVAREPASSKLGGSRRGALSEEKPGGFHGGSFLLGLLQ